MDAWNTPLEGTAGQTDNIHIISVSTHGPNLDLVRDACLDRWIRCSYVHLDTRADAKDYAHSIAQSPDEPAPSIIFLDLDTSPEESWVFLHEMEGSLEFSKPLKIGLAVVEESEDAARRFGNMVTTVLPLPRRKSQADILVGLIGESWMGPSDSVTRA